MREEEIYCREGRVDDFINLSKKYLEEGWEFLNLKDSNPFILENSFAKDGKVVVLKYQWYPQIKQDFLNIFDFLKEAWNDIEAKHFLFQMNDPNRKRVGILCADCNKWYSVEEKDFKRIIKIIGGSLKKLLKESGRLRERALNVNLRIEDRKLIQNAEKDLFFL